MFKFKSNYINKIFRTKTLNNQIFQSSRIHKNNQVPEYLLTGNHKQDGIASFEMRQYIRFVNERKLK